MLRRPATWLVPLAVVAALVVLVAVLLLLPRILYPPLSAAELAEVASAERRIELQQAQSQLQNSARGILLQGTGGLLLVAGALATWRQLHISRQGQITERFTRAIDQLGSDNLDVRQGGIYALERIAKNSYEDRPTIVTILTAFVRSHAPWLVLAPGGPRHPTPTVDSTLPWLQGRATDVQGALTVLARRPPCRDERAIYLSYSDLRRAYLRGGQFSGMECRHSNLAGAVLRDGRFDHADLHDTDLRGTVARDATFVGATLRGAYLSNADLRGADLQGADLRQADLDGADLCGADLRGARLEGATLSGARDDAHTRWPVGFDRGPGDPAAGRP